MKIENRERFNRRIAAIAPEIRKELRDALAKAAEETASTARRLAPVGRTGRLRASIVWRYGDEETGKHAQGVKGGHSLSVSITAGNERVRYAHLVEFGAVSHEIEPRKRGEKLSINGRLVSRVRHPGSPAQPFFYPAFRLMKKKAKSTISRSMSKAIKRAVTK